MRDYIGGGIVVIGLLMLLLGFAMPATTTQTSRTCYDDPLSYGQSCATTTYESPNTGKYSAVGMGVLLSILGGGIIYSDSISSKPSQAAFDKRNLNNLSERGEKGNKNLNSTIKSEENSTLVDVVENNTTNEDNNSDEKF
jgi:hypothetical protein